ncbi:MAG: CFI-box-CTERM domain-containing protein [Thermodesulfobacteriota bacterium]
MSKRLMNKLILMVFFLVPLLMWSGSTTNALEIPEGLETVTGEDGSVWEVVNLPGFGDQDNIAIVSLCPFQENLYALTRNDVTGFELWKTSDTGWTEVTVEGFTGNADFFGWLKPGAVLSDQYDSKYNLKQNIWGDMIEFKGSLYVAVSSGYQGAQLYGSQGLEIWRFDGTVWEPVVSPAVDSDEAGTVTAIEDCTIDDTALTAQLTDDSKNWTADEWTGCVLRLEGEFDGSEGTVAGTPGIRVFDILSNNSDTLTVQQHENANVDTYTVCAEHRIRRAGDSGRPDNVVPGIGTGDSYVIECGIDERGFGVLWDKSIVDFEILDGELYASVGLNYPDGARVWKTSDGVTWNPISEYSFGLFHGLDPNGDPTGFCLVPGTENRNGDPVSSSVTNFGKSDVTGTETLFTGGTGTSGCNGRGARVARLDGTEWNLIVDYFVDDNDEGTNENGFGVADSFSTSNFQAWSWAEYDDLLFVSVIRLKGGSRVMYTDSGSEDDGAWSYSVGGDASELDGFGDVTNIGSHLYVFDSTLYAGTISNVGFNTDSTTNGADIWKGTGSGENLTWTPVTEDGFGDSSIAQFEAFTTFDGMLYVAGSNITASGFAGDQEAGYSGAKIFRLISSEKCFIATATYGSSLADEVVTLRNFRDNFLTESSLGRAVVETYYRFSPPIAKYIAGHETLKVTSRIVLTPLVYSVKYPLVAMLVFMISGVVVAKRLRCLKRRNLT